MIDFEARAEYPTAAALERLLAWTEPVRGEHGLDDRAAGAQRRAAPARADRRGRADARCLRRDGARDTGDVCCGRDRLMSEQQPPREPTDEELRRGLRGPAQADPRRGCPHPDARVAAQPGRPQGRPEPRDRGRARPRAGPPGGRGRARAAAGRRAAARARTRPRSARRSASCSSPTPGSPAARRDQPAERAAAATEPKPDDPGPAQSSGPPLGARASNRHGFPSS